MWSRWPESKNAFIDTKRNVHGAVECMYVALYDAADPPEAAIEDVRSTKAPEFYAWFAVANYLSTVGTGHQDWSTGACREEGADVARVTVIRGGDIPKRTAEIPRTLSTLEVSSFTA